MKATASLALIAVGMACTSPQWTPDNLNIGKKEPSLTELVDETAGAWGIDQQLFRAIVHVESGGRERVQGRVEPHYLRRCRKLVGVGRDATRCASSLGPAQVMGFYALSLGVSLDEVENPRTNLELAAHKLYTCHKRFQGDKAILCYNGLSGDGSYVRKVKAAMEKV